MSTNKIKFQVCVILCNKSISLKLDSIEICDTPTVFYGYDEIMLAS